MSERCLFRQQRNMFSKSKITFKKKMFLDSLFVKVLCVKKVILIKKWNFTSLVSIQNCFVMSLREVVNYRSFERYNFSSIKFNSIRLMFTFVAAYEKKEYEMQLRVTFFFYFLIFLLFSLSLFFVFAFVSFILFLFQTKIIVL